MEKVVNYVKKNYIFCVGMAIFLAFSIFMIVFGILRKGTFSLEDSNSVILECPSSVSPGDTVECDVYLNMTDSKRVYSLNANYDFSSNITYQSFSVDNDECTGESCFEAFEFTQNGFSVINLDGIVGGGVVGKLRVNLSEDVLEDDDISIGLKNIEVCYDDNGEEKMLSLDETSVNLRIKSSNAKLSFVYFGDKQVELIDGVLEYDVNVESDKVIINYDFDGFLSDIETNFVYDEEGYVSVHYGTNEFIITLVSEDETNTSQYIFRVHRGYEFDTEVYSYFKEEGYIYTGTDDAEAIISKLEPLGDDLGYAFEDNGNKLLIKYGDETLLSINVIRLDFGYEVINNSIYLQHDLTYGDLIDTISSERLSIQLYENSGDQVTDENYYVGAGDLMLVLFDDTVLDSYSFASDYLDISGPFIVDSDSRIIKRIPLGTTYGKLREYFNTLANISFLSSDANVEYSDNDVVQTGDMVKITFDDETIIYNLSVLGDITGNGMVKINDVGILYRYLKGKEQLNDLAVFAGDIVNDGTIKINDVGILYRYLKGKETSLEAGDE